MDHKIKINNLDFSYFENKILKNICLEITQGSFVSIIGPNGSGKSTLLKNMARNLIPEEGEIWLENLNLLTMSPKDIAKKMAVVPQTIAIDFPFSVLEAVLMGRTPFLKRFQNEGEKDYRIAQWAMELTNTWHLKDRSVTEVSGGELQRIVVARALTQEPQIILLDEPTAHLDIQHQMELLELLQSLNKTTGLTVVAVLHDLNLASQFSQEMILVHQGSILAKGPVDDVLTKDNIRKVYGMEILLLDNPLTGRHNIIPLARSINREADSKDIRIHIVSGGGTGEYITERLVQLGYQVSCGVLNIGDSDWSKARKLELDLVEEAPFAPISEQNISKNDQLIAKADYIILAPTPFGIGNLPNLISVLKASQKGTPLLIMDIREPIISQDFTGGEASRLMEELRASARLLAYNPQEIIHFLENSNQEKT